MIKLKQGGYYYSYYLWKCALDSIVDKNFIKIVHSSGGGDFYECNLPLSLESAFQDWIQNA